MGQYIHYVLMKRTRANKKQELSFNFDGLPARFSIREFVVTTGLVCRRLSALVREEARGSRLQDTYWPAGGVNYSQLLAKLRNWPGRRPLDDKVKIALLYFLEPTILSSNPKKIIRQEYMSMVDDLKTFNSYPWGTVSYGITIK